MAYLINGTPVDIRKEYFRADGVRYVNLLDASVRAKLGVVETSDPDPFEPNEPWYDQRFYWGVNNPKLLNDREEVDKDGKPLWVQIYDPVTEQMIDSDKRLVTKGLKSQWIAQIKDAAGKMLVHTDWMVIRKAERNIDIPEQIKNLRAAIIDECDRLESDIKSCANVEELIAVVHSQKWPTER